MTWRDEFPDFDHPALFEWLLANAPSARDGSWWNDGMPCIVCGEHVFLHVDYQLQASRQLDWEARPQLVVSDTGDLGDEFETDSPRAALAEIRRRLRDG